MVLIYGALEGHPSGLHPISVIITKVSSKNPLPLTAEHAKQTVVGILPSVSQALPAQNFNNLAGKLLDTRLKLVPYSQN